ncbi:hypothetical protein, partial [Paracoccus sp. 22332]|uniref:hypothetical protein n=1 Tax=Paracoccus sp. 22332 TaxID=3453913 RepID=UPI003F834B0F
MAFDVKKWRDAGVPADLIAILVDVNRAAARIPAKGERGVGIASMVADADNGGIIITMTDGGTTRVEGLTANLAPEDQNAIASALAEMQAVLGQASGFASQAGSAAGAAVEAALADLPLPVIDLDIEGGRLIKIMADGSRVDGPLLPVGPVDPEPEVAPALSGGALDLVDGDLVLVPPTVTAGQPDPQVVLTSLTRDGASVLDEVEDGRIADAAPGVYEAVWTASNGVDPDATAVASLTITAPILQATITPNPLVAGQSASVTFNAPIDGPPTIAQGQTAITATRVGQTNDWTFTPVAAGALIIAAAAAGYASTPWTFEVSPAPADLIVTPTSIFAIANVDAASEPETLALASPTAPAEMMGEWEIDFAPLASGPVLLRDPYIAGTPAVGQTMTLHLPPPLSLIAGSEPTFDWSWPDGSKGKTYVNRAEDAGVPYDVDVTLTDGN